MTKRTRLMALSIGLVLALAPLAAGQLASRPAEDWVKTLESPERLAYADERRLVERVTDLLADSA